MSFNVSKTSSIPCLQKLVDAINADVAIVTVCEFIRLDAPSTMTLTFTGTGPLTGAEDAALDSLLGSFICPPQPIVGVPTFIFNAVTFENPTSVEWPVNSLATAIKDPLNNSLTVRTFDDTIPEGIGIFISVPFGVTEVTFQLRCRRRTADVDTPNVTLDMYSRPVPDGGSVGSWSAPLTLAPIVLPNGTEYIYNTQSLLLSATPISAGESAQFELVRTGGTLTGDWMLVQVVVAFT